MSIGDWSIVIRFDTWLHPGVVGVSRTIQKHFHCNRNHLVAFAFAIALIEVIMTVSLAITDAVLQRTAEKWLVLVLTAPGYQYFGSRVLPSLRVFWESAMRLEADPSSALSPQNCIPEETLEILRVVRREMTVVALIFLVPSLLETLPMVFFLDIPNVSELKLLNACGFFTAYVIALHIIDSDHVVPEERTSLGGELAPEKA